MTEASVKRLLVGIGVGAVGFGVAAMVVPRLAGVVGVTEAFVTLVGVFALLQAGRSVSDGWSVRRRYATLPDAHRTDPANVTGAAFDRALERSGHRRTGSRYRTRIARHLRHTVVETLVVETGEPRETVRARVEDGRWTDDSVAAAFFAGEYDPTVRDRLRALVGRETTYQRRVRRVVAALERRVQEADRD
jgi:hypothetical protein